MNDDELIDRLRRTLRAEAAAVTPGHGPPRMTPPRRRRPERAAVPSRAVAVLAAAAAIAIAIPVTVRLTRGGAPVHVTVAGPHPGVSRARPHRHPTPTAVTPTTTAPTPVTPTTTAPPRTTPTTVSAPGVDRVGPGFVPESVTFVTTQDGWVLGTEPCAARRCLRLAHTADGGASWTDREGPPTAGALGGQSFQVRFANPYDGWVYSTTRGAGLLWSTHTGGATWSRPALPGGPGATIDSIETAHGLVVAAVVSAAGEVAVESARVDSDSWTPDITLPGGAGPTPEATVVLQQTTGWVVVDNPGLVSAARLEGGSWARWTTVPCASTQGPALLAAPTSADVTIVCGPDGGASGFQSVEASHDGGGRFDSVAEVRSSDYVSAVASPTAGTIVGIASTAPGALVASFDRGVDWQPVYTSGDGTIVQVGFENRTQGVAIARTAQGGVLLMTTDGGHNWRSVDLRA